MALTPKQERFVAEYLIDLNATQAAIRAGYARSGARTEGARLLADADISAEVAVLMGERAERTAITAERVLQAIAAVAFGDIRGMFDDYGALVRPGDWDDATAAAVDGIDIVTVAKGEGAVEHVAKIKRMDRLKALDMLARHLALYNDKIEVKVTDGLADRVARAKARGGIESRAGLT
jgi:phage terminase small subunit